MVVDTVLRLKKVPNYSNQYSYPYSSSMQIDGIVYRFYFRVNSYDNTLVLKIKRYTDGVTVFSGRLCDGTPVKVYNPDYRTPLFALLPIDASPDSANIVLLDQNSLTHEDLEEELES